MCHPLSSACATALNGLAVAREVFEQRGEAA